MNAFLLGSPFANSDPARWESEAATLLRPAGPDDGTGRIKIWELEAGTHCSVIGTCLDLNDLRRLARKAGVRMAPDADDHDIHGYFVTQAARRTAFSKLINKALDRKYAPQLLRFRSSAPDELWALWRQATTNGDVAGAYWAVMTHRAVPRPMRIRAYNEIHMLSHLMGKSSRNDIKRIRQLEAAQAALAQRLERTRTRADAALQERDGRIRTLETELAAATAAPQGSFAATVENRKRDRRIDRLWARFETQEQRLKVERARARSAERQLAKIVDVRNREALRASDSASLALPLSSAAQAVDDGADETLSGQALLYVGGYREVAPRLRAHVEEKGGTFLYHDGGIEMQNTRLSGLVSRAAAVLSPVSCISHDACLQLKRLCKRYGKRLILLRSGGLSGFVSAVGKIEGPLRTDGMAAPGPCIR